MFWILLFRRLLHQPQEKSLGKHFSFAHNFWSWVNAWASICGLLVETSSLRQFWHYSGASRDVSSVMPPFAFVL
jgi:hypothetical protein